MSKEFMSVKGLIKVLLDHRLDDVVFVGDLKGNRVDDHKLVVRSKGFFEKVK